MDNSGRIALIDILKKSTFEEVKLEAIEALLMFIPVFGGSHAHIEENNGALYTKLYFSENNSKVKKALEQLVERYDKHALEYGPPSVKRTFKQITDACLNWLTGRSKKE